jgi:hypothetical protein
MGVTGGVYEHLYRQAAGEPFWPFYLARQLGVAAATGQRTGLAGHVYALAWYLGRVLWFPFPWSLSLLAATWHARRLPARPSADGDAPSPRSALAGGLFAIAAVVLYVGVFSLSDRRADRYIFPAYYAVGAAGGVAAVRASVRLRRVAERLDRPWVPAAVWAVTFGAHLFAGRLGLPTVKVWAPGP